MTKIDSKVTTLSSGPVDLRGDSAADQPVKRLIGKSSGHDAQLSGVLIKINIYSSDQEHGSDAVLVGLNGVMYQIPRGMTHEVPEEVVGVLRDAVTDVTVPIPGGGTQTRPVPRYNFQVLG